MLAEQEAREAAIVAQLGKITKANPHAVPLYIIIHSSKTEEVIEQPLTLCSKDSLVKDLLVKLHKKYPKFQHVYLFGREGGQESASAQTQKNRKKGKESSTGQEPQKILPIQERLMLRRVEEIHQIYKDPRGLLVLIVSQKALVANKKQPLYEPILLLLAVVFGVAFLYLSFSDEQPLPRSGSEMDYIV